ncbi:MAG: DUF4091 domain-containing protein [Clostridia bacterium]|nr:DUF4091 domain-containing protein [Clostridia bacterium]
MKIKRLLALLVAVVMVCALFAGCGEDKKPQPTEAPQETAVPADNTENPTEVPEVTAAPADNTENPTDVPEETPAASEEPTAETTEEPTGEETEQPTEEQSEQPTEEQSEEPTEEQPTAGQPTEVPTEQPTEAPTEAPTEEPTPEPGPTSATYVTFDSSKAVNYFTGPNATKASLEEDPDFGHVVKITTTGITNDPFIFFNYKGYLQAYGITPASASTYKVVLLKIRQENCSNSSFEIFYCAGSLTGAAAGYSRTSGFDNSDTDWQYVLFNLDGANGWNGTINGFRFDYMFTAAGANETIYVGAVILAKNMDEVKDLISGGVDINALSAADQQRAEQLINSASDPAPAVSNTKLTAANEDSSINLWFNHPYVKTPESSTTSSGMNTYQIRMAKNEIEGVQFLLSSTAAKTGLTAELSAFTNSSGDTLKHVICEGYYFDDIEGQSIVDPIPELKGSFDLKAGKSKTFLIKAYTDKNTKAGQYSAVLTIKDSQGREVKKANVYVYVWNFALPDASNCKIQADLSWWNIYSNNAPWLYSGDDSLTYCKYYEYLLENKVNCYRLPFLDDEKTHDNPYSDPRINKYLDDPRVQCFNPVGYGTDHVTDARIQNAYNYLSQNPEWLKKAYFYPVDEPQNTGMLDTLISYAKKIKSVFGSSAKIIAPMHINGALQNSTQDFFSYVKDYVNVWCPHNYFFNTLADYKNNPQLMFRYYTSQLENNLGSFKDRMAAEQAEGDEVWWYVTRFPHNPEITLSIDDQEVVHRIMFWQQKLYDIDGFLYYMVNDWHYGTYPWNSLHETDNSYPYNVYGNGVLVYNGFEDSEGQPYQGRDRYDQLEDKSYNAYPVGSLRLESVRDGAEDYDYLTILDELYGEGTSDLVIKQITTSLGNYKADAELFNRLRIAVGNLIAAKN